MGKWSFESNIGDLLENETTRALIEELAPEAIGHPMIEIGKSLTIEQALPFIEGFAAEMEGIAFEDRLEDFKARLEAIED